jgi:GntR family transcriptional regulator
MVYEWYILPMDLAFLRVDKALPTPAYLQLKEGLRRAISEGAITPGAALPSERELAEALGLSRMTVRRAFEELVSDNLVEQRQGSGTYVLPRRHEQIIDRVLGFSQEAESLGFKAGSQLLAADYLPADQQVADALGITKGAAVLQLVRLRTADEEPLALQAAHLSPRFQDFPLEHLRNSGSLYATLEHRYGVKPHGARQTVSARLPTRQECQLLRIGKEVPLLAMERVTFDAQGRAFEYVRSAYRSDKYQMALILRAP